MPANKFIYLYIYIYILYYYIIYCPKIKTNFNSSISNDSLINTFIYYYLLIFVTIIMIIHEEESIELNKRSHRRPPRQVPVQPTQLLFCSFIFWASLSFAASLIICTGYWLPYWIQGQFHKAIDASFGSFRRCNYPIQDEHGRIQIVPQCGRYRTFDDIPSFSWKVCFSIFFNSNFLMTFF